MHVPPGPDPRRSQLARSVLRDADTVALRTSDLEAQRPGNRAIIAHRLELVWKACEDDVLGHDAEGRPVVRDFRYVDLAARVLDRLVKVLETGKPDPEVPEVVHGERDPVRVQVSAAMDELEAKVRGDSGAGGA